jgi:uncharacterized phage protein (TIGR01671 family)
MRDIKFRCWDTENKEMLEVQELDYEDSYNGQPMIRTTMYSDYFDTEDMILMQYVGLKDKNGKEIYEGDIVKFRFKDDREEFPDLIGYIEYQTTFTAFRIMSNQGSFKIDITEIKFIEVIGNIYKNPELLEEGE